MAIDKDTDKVKGAANGQRNTSTIAIDKGPLIAKGISQQWQ